jgi:hypothetical protein
MSPVIRDLRDHESNCDGACGVKKACKQLNRAKVPMAHWTVRLLMKSVSLSGVRRA